MSQRALYFTFSMIHSKQCRGYIFMLVKIISISVYNKSVTFYKKELKHSIHKYCFQNTWGVIVYWYRIWLQCFANQKEINHGSHFVNCVFIFYGCFFFSHFFFKGNIFLWRKDDWQMPNILKQFFLSVPCSPLYSCV